jgi:hypothetical protein
MGSCPMAEYVAMSPRLFMRYPCYCAIMREVAQFSQLDSRGEATSRASGRDSAKSTG